MGRAVADGAMSTLAERLRNDSYEIRLGSLLVDCDNSLYLLGIRLVYRVSDVCEGRIIDGYQTIYFGSNHSFRYRRTGRGIFRRAADKKEWEP